MDRRTCPAVPVLLHFLWVCYYKGLIMAGDGVHPMLCHVLPSLKCYGRLSRFLSHTNEQSDGEVSRKAAKIIGDGEAVLKVGEQTFIKHLPRPDVGQGAPESPCHVTLA